MILRSRYLFQVHRLPFRPHHRRDHPRVIVDTVYPLDDTPYSCELFSDSRIHTPHPAQRNYRTGRNRRLYNIDNKEKNLTGVYAAVGTRSQCLIFTRRTSCFTSCRLGVLRMLRNTIPHQVSVHLDSLEYFWTNSACRSGVIPRYRLRSLVNHWSRSSPGPALYREEN